MSKSPKQQPNCLKRTATSIFLIVLYGALCDVSDYIVTISCHRSTIKLDLFPILLEKQKKKDKISLTSEENPVYIED
jgi:hypothetical protein